MNKEIKEWIIIGANLGVVFLGYGPRKNKMPC
jgi:hypothetical protein